MWLNAQQIMQWHWAWDARQISRQSTIQLTHFPFPSVEDSQLKGVGIILVLGMMRCLVVQATKPQKPQKCPNSWFRHSRGMIAHQRILTLSEANFWSLQGLTHWQGHPSIPVKSFFRPSGHWACPCATFLQYREAHYPFRFSSDGELTT
jgi:hypothetical protein